MSPAAVDCPSKSERTADESDDPPFAKAVLFCPHCGHESPVDGDWAVAVRSEDGNRLVVYECPDCEAVVTARPAFEDPT